MSVTLYKSSIQSVFVFLWTCVFYFDNNELILGHAIVTNTWNSVVFCSHTHIQIETILGVSYIVNLVYSLFLYSFGHVYSTLNP